jgi:hypothetical protein
MVFRANSDVFWPDNPEMEAENKRVFGPVGSLPGTFLNS